MEDVAGVPDEVVAHYEDEYDEAGRLAEGIRQLELVRTQEVVTRHLGGDAGGGRGLRVLDAGGGPGVYARWLAEQGHDVVLVDPMERHVATAGALRDEGLSVTAEVGDARRLRFDGASFDAVLMLGPLYHLTERSDRVLALQEAARVVCPGGLVVAAAISRFASLLDGLGRGFLFDPDFQTIVERDLAEGQHRNPDRRPHWFTTAYFHHPDDLPGEARDAGLDVVEVVGVEGPAAFLAGLGEHWDDPRGREVILWSARAVEREPAMIGASPHLLLVARRAA